MYHSVALWEDQAQFLTVNSQEYDHWHVLNDPGALLGLSCLDLRGHHSHIWSLHQPHKSTSSSAWHDDQRVTECNKVHHCRHAFWKKRRCQAIFLVRCMGSYAGQSEVNVLVQHAPIRHCCSLWWRGDGSTQAELCQPSKMVLSKLSSVIKVKHWLNNVSNDWGSESGLTFRLVDLYMNMYNTFHSNVLIYHIHFPWSPL